MKVVLAIPQRRIRTTFRGSLRGSASAENTRRYTSTQYTTKGGHQPIFAKLAQRIQMSSSSSPSKDLHAIRLSRSISTAHTDRLQRQGGRPFAKGKTGADKEVRRARTSDPLADCQQWPTIPWRSVGWKMVISAVQEESEAEEEEETARRLEWKVTE
ncbi:hypothetical protein PV04_07408 [Phialophora macrospora]|uniref:Uncharacterized protein n=1 Tax=Phialophora macrospora TaxID=1851006 RepID=A0A0D2FE58_9EURO|nr:hypothetical protein PV04_07408 [Phialophora macrospora]